MKSGSHYWEVTFSLVVRSVLWMLPPCGSFSPDSVRRACSLTDGLFSAVAAGFTSVWLCSQGWAWGSPASASLTTVAGLLACSTMLGLLVSPERQTDRDRQCVLHVQVLAEARRE